MPIAIDQITRKKLILVKQLYQQAMIQSTSKHSAISRILSVIGFDLANETVLRILVNVLDASKTPTDGFQGLIQQCESLLATSRLNPIPDKANILHVHSIRNDAQHKAKYPNEADVSDCRTYTRDFLQKLTFDTWKMEFEKISLTDIVQHKQVKNFLVAAENALNGNEYQKAVECAAVGLTISLNRVREQIIGRIPTSNEFMLERGSSYDGRDAYNAFQKMQEILLLNTFGMNYSDYMRYSLIAGRTHFTLNGGHHHYGGKENISASDAEFVVAYCTDAVVQIESGVGDLDAPFGQEPE